MIMKMLGLTPDPLVRTLFAFFICVLMITLVVLVVWVLVFCYQQESIPNIILLHLMCSYQYESNPKVFDSSKCFSTQIIYYPSKFETQFYSYNCSLTSTCSLLML